MSQWGDAGLTFLRELDIRGQKVKVYVAGNGQFRSLEPECSAATFDDLRLRLMKLLKKATTRLAIPVTVDRTGQRHNGLANALLRGRHGGNKNVLIEWEGQKGTDQLSSYDYRTMFRALTDAEMVEWDHLNSEAQAAEAALRAWVEEREVNPGKLVDEALNKAVEKEDE